MKSTTSPESDATLTADKPYPVLFSPGAYFKDERQYELPQKEIG